MNLFDHINHRWHLRATATPLFHSSSDTEGFPQFVCAVQLLITILLLSHTRIDAVFGQTSPKRQDSLRTKQTRLRDVEISADRLTSRAERSVAPITMLNASQIQATGARQTADVLSFVPGAFVRNYGGVGGLKTISLRGANAAQTSIFLNGVRLSSTQTGQFDLSAIPAGLLEEVEVVRGGGSARFGAGAMAGAVNLRTRSSLRAPTLTTTAEAASFQEYRASVSGGVPLSAQGNIGLLGHCEAQTAAGNYPFGFKEFGRDTVLERLNADARLIAASLLAFAQLGRWRLQANLLPRYSERGTPGAVVQGSVEMARARLAENDLLFSVSATDAFTEQSLFTVQSSCKFNTLHYQDPDARQFGANGINERFQAEDFAASARLWFDESVNAPTLALSHEWNVETTLSELRGNMFQIGVGNRVRRVGIAFSAKGDMRVRLQSLADNSSELRPSELRPSELRLNAALRVENFSDVGGALSPLLGGALLLDSAWTLRAQWSYNFRPPSFNEMYYLNFGNATLKPERAHALNLGATYSIPASVLTFAADAFFHRTYNQILAVQTTPFTISAQNIEEAQTLGMEASIDAALWEDVSAQANYTYQRVTNETPRSFVEGRQLVYTPEHLASVRVLYHKAWFSAGFTGQFVGDRYSLPSNTVDSRLPAFLTATVFVEGTLQIATTRVNTRLLCDNCFDERYAVIRNFPMPGRAFRVSIRADF